MAKDLDLSEFGGTPQLDLSEFQSAQPEKSSSLRRVADQGIKLAQGVVGLPESFVGMADLVTNGQAGKLAESAGVRFKDAKNILGEYLSPEQKAADAEVAKAKGFFPTIGAAVQNPSTILGAAMESAPSMLGGGVVSRGARALAPKISPILAGAMGEGAVAAGQNAEQVRSEDPNGTLTPQQSAILAASGLLTGGISLASGKLANKLGIGDVETMLAAGRRGVVGDAAEAAAANKGVMRRIGEGFLNEGVGQELPQSYQEQVAQNLAQGKPWDEGAANAAAMGLLSGGLTGSVANVVSGNPAAKPAPPNVDSELDSANATLGAVGDQYGGIQTQGQLGWDGQPSTNVIIPENVSGQPLPRNIVEVPRQDGQGMTQIDRTTGPLSSAAADAVDGGLTDAYRAPTGAPLFPFANAQAAQAHIDGREDADRLKITPHPNVKGRLAVVPKDAQTLATMDAKAAALESNQTRTAQVESEDGNAAEEIKAGQLTFAGRPVTEMQSPKGAAVVNHFTTAQGSEYIQTADGMTQRNKSVHANTGGADAGIHGWNDSAVFIDPSHVVATNAPFGITVQRLQESGQRLAIQQKDGVISALLFDAKTKAWRVATTLDAFPAAVKSGLMSGQEQVAAPYTDAPTVGHDVFEYTNRPDGRGVSSVHAGSPVASVTAVGQQVNAPVDAGAQTAQALAQEDAQAELETPTAQPTGVTPAGQQLNAQMAGAANQTAQTRTQQVALEEGSVQPARRKIPLRNPQPDPNAAQNAAQAAQINAQDAAQSEIGQSIGKESKARTKRLPGESNEAYMARRAAESNQQKQAAKAAPPKAAPTKDGDNKAVREALGDKDPDATVVDHTELPEASKAKEGQLSRQGAEFIKHVAKLFGKRVVFVQGMSADGFWHKGNTVYLNANASVNQVRVLGHELTHTMKAQSRKAYNHMLDAVKGLLTDAEYANQYENYFGKPMPEGYLNDQTKEELAEEWMADLSGNRFAEAEFWQSVFEQVEAKHGPELAKGIIAKLRMAIVNALNKLMSVMQGNAFAVDERMGDHLDDIRKAVAAGFAEYAQDVKAGAAEGVSGEVKFSQGKDEPAIQHQMEIERETRELATTTRLSAAEQTAIGAEAKRIGVTRGKLELEVRRIKAQFPVSGGWAPMEFAKVNKVKYAKKGVLSMDTVEFQKQPYNFHLGVSGKDDSATRPKRLQSMAKGISDEIVELRKKAGEGDKNAKITMDQIGWYSKVAALLHHQFGGFADFLAQLMGPTSANTPVEGNVKYAMAALKAATSGKWDALIADTIRWHEGVMLAAAGLDAVIDANRAKPKAERLTSKDLAQTQAFKDAMRAVEEAAPYTGEEPQQDSGAKFGMATQGVVEILANTWSDFQRGDAPKTKNYYQNLIGRQFTGATIDVWAARTLRRMAGLSRIPTAAEKGVAGKIGANLAPGAEFGFGQAVFTKAAENLRNSGIADFANTTPADVQAMIWFSEKENWARNNWTNKIGEGGSAEAEFNLQGNADREGLEEARRLSRKGLPHEGNTKPNKTEEKAQQASTDAGVGQFPTAKDTPQYKARLEKIIAKAVAARNEARVQFESMRGAVDRWIAGVTPATDFTPSDATMAEVGAELESKVAMGDDAHKVLAFKALPTMGRYGYDERSIDFEGVTRQGYNGTDMLGPLLEIAKEHAQDGLLFGRVLRADEDIDYLRHRPGLELYLAKGAPMEKAQPILAKLDELGFKQFTFVVDPVRAPEALSGKMGNVVGLRYIFTPEFALREPNPEYGGDPSWAPGSLTDDQIRDRMVAKAAELDRLAIQLRAIPGVSSSEAYDYEANVYFWGDYDNEIGKIREESVGGASGTGWQGQPVRRGLEGADRRREMDPGSEDAKSFAARRDVLRGDPKLSPERRGPSAQVDGSSGSSARPNAVKLTGVHFSSEARTSLDGRFNGRGLKGAEAKRLARATDSRIKERVYFYVDEGNGIRPESGVGAVSHTASIENLYDVTGDPQGLFKSNDDNANESALLDAGYSGYYVPKVFNNQGVAVVLGNASRGIAVAQSDYTKGSISAAPPAPYKRGLTSKELSTIDMPALQAVAPSAKLRMGTFTVDQAELAAARAEMSKQGIDLPEPKFSTARAPFYSALSREVNGLKMQSAPGFGWQAAIKGMLGKGLIKQDEVEWSGLNDWLNLQQGKVTKEQVTQYLDANGVQIEETTLGDVTDATVYQVYEVKKGRRVRFVESFLTEDEADQWIRDNDDEMTTYDIVEDFNPEKTQTASSVKHDQYKLEGGENYREVLLTLPTDGKSDYKSAHWDQKNVLAHLRVDDRVDADGNKVLFVQEIQSDWAQDGRKKGFASTEPKTLPAGYKAEQNKDGKWVMYNPIGGRLSSLFDTEQAAVNAVLSRADLMGGKGVPSAPFLDSTDKWLGLALKRVMVMAAQGGYDKVAFINGQQSADRFSLDTHLSKVTYRVSGSDNYKIQAFDKQGNKLGIPPTLDAENLEDHVGKEIAQKIVNTATREDQSLTGEGLKVEARGMREFYDKIVPSAVKTLLKKLGGGQIETASFDDLTQPAVTLTDAMREKVGEGLPMFSKKRVVGASRTYTPAQMAAMANTGRQVDELTFTEQIKNLFKDAGKKLAQGIADQFAPVKALDGKAYGLLRLAKGASGAFEALLHGGKLKLTDNVYDIDTNARGGVIESLLKPLHGEHHDFLWWVAAHRAEALGQVGKEHLFTAADIAANKSLADGDTDFDYTLQHGIRKGQTTRKRSDIYRDAQETFKGFNKNVLDMAEQSGLIDGATRHLWENEFYVPFYRVSEENDGGVRGMNIKAAAVRQQAFKALKGGKDKLNSDLLDNTLMNWAHLLDASAKNRAAKATIDAAEKMGVAIPGNQTALAQMGASIHNKNGVVWFMDGGQKRYSLIDNQGEGPYIMTALSALEYAGMRNPAMNALSAMKYALTFGVTASPFFKVKNLIRDSVQVIGTGNISYNAAANVAKGWALTDPKSDAYFRLLAGGGTIHFGTMMEGTEGKRVQALVDAGVDSATILNSDQKVQAFYRKFIEPAFTAYGELGNRGEAVNRASLYDQLRKQGVGHAEASLQARDLMDFSMQGSWTGIRFLTQVVPFMNARIQGLYKLGRASKEDPMRISAVLGATTLFSLALLAAFGDDDDWKQRTDSDRNNFWWFKFGGTAFRIPKPFEIGSVATLAERTFELAFDNEMTDKRFMEQVMTLLGDNLSMNPVPQLVKPIMDVYANKDSFTGAPIENSAQQKLKSEYRFNDRTTMAARGASTALNAVTGVVGKEAPSPVQIDHMLRGYFGWLGATVVSSADVLVRPATGQPQQATPDYMKVITGNLVSDLRDAPSRYVSHLYDQAKVIEKAHSTWKMLIKEGKTAEAQEYRADNKQVIDQYKQIEAIKRRESKFNEMIRMIERNTTMDPDTKRERIRAIQGQKEKMAKLVRPLA